MHAAPAVDYPVGHARFQAVTLVAAWAIVVAAFAWWLTQSARLGWEHGAGLAVACLSGLLAWFVRQAPATGALQWDGQVWWWEAGDLRVRGVVLPCLDLQTVLLLAFAPETGPRQWFWMGRSAAPARWIALRRAVHAPATGTGAGAGAISANGP